jgi:hypothetical protein
LIFLQKNFKSKPNKQWISNMSAPTKLLYEIAKEWTLEEWKNNCSRLTPLQLAELLPLASVQDEEGKQKLQLLFTHLPQDISSQIFAKQIEAPQVLELIRWIKNFSHGINHRQKLSFIFSGLSPIIFWSVIAQANQEDLEYLKEEALTEPIQHHLSLLAHHFHKRVSALYRYVETLKTQFEVIDIQQIQKEELQNLMDSIDHLKREGKDLLELINRSLIMTWNTSRIDLIQELGSSKELCQRCLSSYLQSSKQQESPFNLLQILIKKVDEVFSDLDEDGDLTPMKDSTPAMEALTKLSIWQIKDYAELGLLPSEIILNKRESLENRDQLFKDAEHSLNKMGLKTLADLKSAKIYSKKALMEYINAFQNQLTD